eukprot:5379381-Pleurochrysis_carterae.AAC.1
MPSIETRNAHASCKTASNLGRRLEFKRHIFIVLLNAVLEYCRFQENTFKLSGIKSHSCSVGAHVESAHDKYTNRQVLVVREGAEHQLALRIALLLELQAANYQPSMRPPWALGLQLWRAIA